MDETVSEKLFVCLSKYIVNSSLKEICIDLLEIPHIRLAQIQVKSNDAEEQILQVSFFLCSPYLSWICTVFNRIKFEKKIQLLLAWHRRGPRTNRELLNLIVRGIIRKLIVHEALPAVCEKAQLAKDEPEVKELFEKLEADRQSQICLSSLVQKSRSK